MVGVLTNDRPAAARAFVRRHRATWPVGIDEGASVATAWGAVGLPHTYFIRPDGTLASHQLGELTRRAWTASWPRSSGDPAAAPPAGTGGSPPEGWG